MLKHAGAWQYGRVSPCHPFAPPVFPSAFLLESLPAGPPLRHPAACVQHEHEPRRAAPALAPVCSGACCRPARGARAHPWARSVRRRVAQGCSRWRLLPRTLAQKVLQKVLWNSYPWTRSLWTLCWNLSFPAIMASGLAATPGLPRCGDDLPDKGACRASEKDLKNHRSK